MTTHFKILLVHTIIQFFYSLRCYLYENQAKFMHEDTIFILSLMALFIVYAIDQKKIQIFIESK